MKKFFKKLAELLAKLFERKPDSPTTPDPGPIHGPVPGAVPPWDATTKASCWQGSNAQTRHMNILSPHMPENLFKERVKWAKGRGCNTIHAFLANEGDGEYAGYCIYGRSWGWTVDAHYVKVMKDRIDYIGQQGMAFVPWLLADDSSKYNAAAATNFDRYATDLKNLGLLDRASLVVPGLEIDEYYKSAHLVESFVTAVRNHYRGKIGVHCTSYKLLYAYLSDVVFYQVDPGKNVAWIKTEATRVKKAIGGKPLNFFELSRHEDRALAEAAFDGGADMVGNY